jgi:RpiR family carbohydrate utilization transcriptional regulator
MGPSPPEAGNPDPQTGVLIRLRGLYPSLKAALQKVADVILRQPEMAIYASVNEVAAAAGVSEATVMRFCRTLGFKGFQDFKIALAREMVTPRVTLPAEVTLGDDPETVISKVFQASLGALQDTLEILEIDTLSEAVRLLLNSRQIMLIGMSGSIPAVIYGRDRFLLLGLNAHAYTDHHLMLMAASRLSGEDVVVAISHTGSPRELVETVRLAQDQGARAITITNNSLSPLAQVSDLVLVTASREARFQKEEIASFLCQIAVIDGLVALISLARPDRVQENLAKAEKALAREF